LLIAVRSFGFTLILRVVSAEPENIEENILGSIPTFPETRRKRVIYKVD
jgi:hypothetical protein